MHYWVRTPLLGKIIFPDIINRILNKRQNDIYLTFDDGPSPEITPAVLELLRKYNIKATFFCVGEKVKKHPDIYQHILKDGHSVGNHTFNHLNGWKASVKDYMENVKQCAQLINSNLFRPPYGKITMGQYNALKKDYKLIFWDVMCSDYIPSTTAEECFEIVKTKTRSGSILIFHDNNKTMDKLPELLRMSIEFAESKGFNFKKIT